jgi:hypothetical protein
MYDITWGVLCGAYRQISARSRSGRHSWRAGLRVTGERKPGDTAVVAPVIDAAQPLLSKIRLERLAAAFELAPAEILADAVPIVDWCGRQSDLEALLNARHAWRTDEAFHFIRWVRREVWCTCNGVPDERPKLAR